MPDTTHASPAAVTTTRPQPVTVPPRRVTRADHGTRPARATLTWLACATAALTLLAAAAAVVSWDAQYVMIARARPIPVIAALEAGIPDAGAAVFASLGIALALHGRRALRPRLLNVGCVGLSVAMNALAAAPGWRATAIWVMPAAVYALASDTLIGVIRASAITRNRPAKSDPLTDTDATPLAVAGSIVLWFLRLALAPASTLAGFRNWVITQCPAAPRPRTPAAPAPEPAANPAPQQKAGNGSNGKPRKQDLLIALAAQRHDLASLPLHAVASIATATSRDIGLHPGTARRILRAHVRALQQHHPGTPRPPAS